ncbi:hypothetical protein AB0M47_22200 [Hamadaea sp. NPDC051192]|uniref:hypothetical protein n=1 Tax=Hamadaea sp. NPDC051192 TaxID=3154940 RepID=UPI00343172D6
MLPAPAPLTVLEQLTARLHATRSAGPAARRGCRGACRATPGSARELPQSRRRRLGQCFAPGRRRIG